MKRRLRFLTLAGGLAGAGLLAWLVFQEGGAGLAAVAEGFRRAGWTILLLAAYRIVPMGLDALGWRRLLPASDRPSLGFFVYARWVADSWNALLPVAQVGGHVVRAIMLCRTMADKALGAASVVADFSIGLVTQFVFVVGSLLLTLLVSARGMTWTFLASVIVVGLAILGGLLVVQRMGVFGLLERLLRRLPVKGEYALLAGGGERLDALITAFYRSAALLPAMAWRLAGWVSKSGDIFIAALLIGQPVTIVTALALEACSTAVSNAAFMVPGALGVREGSIVAVGAMLGLSPETALTLALFKRVREILVGAPGLATWLAMEARASRSRQRALRLADRGNS